MVRRACPLNLLHYFVLGPLAKLRVRVEHAISGVKRSRIVKDVFRNKKPGLSDASMEVACGLHNLRVDHRKTKK